MQLIVDKTHPGVLGVKTAVQQPTEIPLFVVFDQGGPAELPAYFRF